MEQILASHSQVEGTAELPTLIRLAHSIGRYRADKKVYPESISDLRGRDLKAYGRQYLEESAAFRSTDRPFFTDKTPNNFAHIGLIHLILPNAKVINARRHPFDSCLGGFKQLFAKGQHFTYDMAELAAYYQQYHATMQYWHQVLPGKVLDVHYEGNGHGPRNPSAPHPRPLRPAFRRGLLALPRKPEGGEDRKFRAGPAADLHGRARLLAPLRETPRALARNAR